MSSSTVAARIGTLTSLGWVLLIGIGVLTVALGLLLLTRWGNSRPLRKCIALSVWTHALLFIFASSIDVFERPVMRPLSLRIAVSDDEESAEVPQPATTPWEALNETLPELPQPEMERPPSESTAGPLSPPKLALVEAPPLVDPSQALAPPPPPSAPPAPEPTPVEPERERQPPPADPIEMPAPRFDESAPPSPMPPAAEEPPPIPDAPATEVRLGPGLMSPQPPSQEPPPPPQPERVAVRPDPIIPRPALPEGVPGAPQPGRGHAVPELFQLRMIPDRAELIRSQGGSPETERAVEGALAWLVQHQSGDGRWDASQFGAGREGHVFGQDRRGTGAEADTGVTGLALLAFLGGGHTHLSGKHAATVARGLDYLLRHQAGNGHLAGKADVYAFMYCHGMASLALSEAYALSGDPRLRGAVQRAVDYTLSTQNRTTGGWRYRPGETGDTSQLGWQLMALKSAALAGIDIPVDVRVRAGFFLESVASGDQRGLASYRPGERPSASMTAEALVCRQFLGLAGHRSTTDEALAMVVTELPGDGPANFYYWYYATLGLYQAGGDAWLTWNEALTRTLLASQSRQADDVGSWDPDPLWGSYGGRVYSTALGALCLEVYYRYLPLYVDRPEAGGGPANAGDE